MIAAKTLLHNLLARGAFPRELPPPFTSKPFAEAVMVTSPLPGAFGEGRYISKPANYNLARAGTLHRLMGIPNPVSYFPLANFISNNWNTIFPDDGLGYSHKPILPFHLHSYDTLGVTHEDRSQTFDSTCRTIRQHARYACSCWTGSTNAQHSRRA